MTIDGIVLITILGMALVTYATRAGGLWLVTRVKLSHRVEKWLGAIPGAVLISIVAPDVAKGGSTAAIGAVVAGAVAWKTRNLLLTMGVGVALVFFLRVILNWH